MNLITIIVPMFNEENNIEQCVITLRNQSNQNFNVVFIDDGSTDNTLLKLESLLNTQDNFNYTIIKQSNKGAAEARKVGIETASSKYVMIYDCDDLLSDNYINCFYETYHEYLDVDIIIPNACTQKKDGGWGEYEFYTDDKILNALDCLKNSFYIWKIHGWFAIKRNIILKSYDDYKVFNPDNKNYINNDEVITRFNFYNSKLIVRSEAIYYYCYNSSSTTKKINQNLYLKINNALIIDQSFSSYGGPENLTKCELISTLWSIFRFKQNHKLEIDNIDNWNKKLKKTINDLYHIEFLRSVPLKQKLQLTMMRVNYIIEY